MSVVNALSSLSLPAVKLAQLGPSAPSPADFSSIEAKLRSYLSEGKVDAAIKCLEEAIVLWPDRTELYLMLADLQAHEGKFKEALGLYQKAFEKVFSSDQPGAAYAQVCQGLSILRFQMRLRMARFSARYNPNPLRMLVRMTGDLLYFMNPVNMVVYAVKRKPAKFSKEQLERFLAQSDEYEEKMREKYSQACGDINFYLADILSQQKQIEIVNAQLEKTKANLVPLEVIDELKTLRRECNYRIEQDIEKITDTDPLEWAYVQALDKKDKDKILLKLKESFENYLSLLGFLASAKLPSDLREKLIDGANAHWDLLEDQIEETLDFAEDQQDLETAFAVFQLLSQLGGQLEGKDLKIEKRKEKMRQLLSDCLKRIIEIAGEKKDYQTLLELAKDQKHLGEFAYFALKTAKDAAVEEKNAGALEEIAAAAFSVLSGDGLSKNQKEDYRKLAVSAHENLLGLYQSDAQKEQKIKTAVMLWRLGRFELALKVFEELVIKTNDKNSQALLLIDLAYMYMALNDREKALKTFRRVYHFFPDPAVKKEIVLLRKKNPRLDDVVFEGNSLASSLALRANFILYSHWFENDGAAAVAAGLTDQYQAAGHKVKIVIDAAPSGIPQVKIEESAVVGIVIKRLKTQGPIIVETKDEIILRELAYAGLKNADPYNENQVEEAAAAASMRLKTFEVVDWKAKTDEAGNTIIELQIVERPTPFLHAGGGGGNLSSQVYLNGGFNNLLGGGETIGLGVDYAWFYGDGFKSFQVFEGRLYYKDPHLFRLGEKHPVSFAVTAERYGRRDFVSGGKEMVSGGSVSFGIQLKRHTGLHVTPSFYHVDNDQGPDYYRQGLRLGLDHDRRDHWLFPSSGHRASVYLEPGVYYGGGSTTGYAKVGASAEKYFSLPADFVLMFGGRGDIGYNLFNGDLFFLGGGYVRGARNFSHAGPAVSAGTIELRSPVWNIGEYGEYAKIQPYLFGDAGAAFRFSGRAGLGWGVGGGVRFGVPFLGLINIYYGFPAGIGFQVGPPIYEEN